MYLPAHFQCLDSDVFDLLANMGGVELVTLGPDGIAATFMPMLYRREGSGQGMLQGHLARANPQVRAGSAGEALVIVHGTDSYISPSYYPSKADHKKVVPTWNYLTVHLYGDLVLHDDPDWLRANVSALTDKHESKRTQPWSVDDAPPDYLEAMLGAIVGVEIVVTRIEAKAKLSQNRNPTDVEGVIAGLEAVGDLEGASAVRHARDVGAQRS